MKNAFRQMYSTLSGRFVSNEGVVAGYVDRIWRKYRAKWGMQMTGMILGTRSRSSQEYHVWLDESQPPWQRKINMVSAIREAAIFCGMKKTWHSKDL